MGCGNRHVNPNGSRRHGFYPSDLTQFIEALFGGKLISPASLEQMKKQSKIRNGAFQVPFYDKIGYGHTGGIDGFRSALSYFPEKTECCHHFKWNELWK
jgi:hypothetical protein